MPLELVSLTSDALPVEVHGVTPDQLRGRALTDIERWPVRHGNRTLALAELFRVRGDAGDGVLRFSGPLESVHGIGAGLQDGTVHVDGSGGRHLGAEMRGGAIRVTGNAGDWLGAEMTGGVITVEGNAGNLAGAAYRGSVRGMSGGTILVQGSVGHEAGHSLRRGLLAVAGDCGDFAGVNMLAGSLLLFGRAGRHPGAGMRRGTLAFLGPAPDGLLPTFRPGCCYEPVFMRLLLAELRRQGFAAAERSQPSRFRLYHGDMVALGRGEILISENTPA